MDIIYWFSICNKFLTESVDDNSEQYQTATQVVISWGNPMISHSLATNPSSRLSISFIRTPLLTAKPSNIKECTLCAQRQPKHHVLLHFFANNQILIQVWCKPSDISVTHANNRIELQFIHTVKDSISTFSQDFVQCGWFSPLSQRFMFIINTNKLLSAHSQSRTL